MSDKRVAVIGAGVSGLVAMKSCLEVGFKPFCFEKESVIGGLWVYSDGSSRGEAGAMYNGLVTNTSKEMTCFSDFPFPKDHPPYLLIHHVIGYLRDYAGHHNLEQYISFDTEVIDVSPVEGDDGTGRWNVTTRRRHQGQTVEQTTDVFDAVMVCTGCNSNIKMPKYNGMDGFKGQIIHSNAFRRGSDFAGQNVLVIGASNSAGDVSTQCSHYANQTYISMRSGCYVFSRRGLNGLPTDSVINRRAIAKAPACIRAAILHRSVESRMDLDSLGLRSNRDIFSESHMFSSSLPDRILNGTLKVKTLVERFTEKGVKFVDETSIEDVDTVICATGYYVTFPFIKPDIFDDTKLELYKHILSPRYTTLAFIGAINVEGGAMPMVELQARWAASVFSGSLRIPDLDARQRDAEYRRDLIIKRYGYLRLFIAALPYQEELADDIGVRPKLTLFLTDPKLAAKVFFGPAYPPSYRLRGPHAWPAAREAVMNGWENTTRPTKTRHVVKKARHRRRLKRLFGTTSIVLVVFVIVKMYIRPRMSTLL